MKTSTPSCSFIISLTDDRTRSSSSRQAKLASTSKSRGVASSSLPTLLPSTFFKPPSMSGGSVTSHLGLKASSGSIQKHDREMAEVAVIPDKQSFPLPIRHFDFLHEDKNLDGKSSHNCLLDNSKHTGNHIGRYESCPRNGESLRAGNTLSRCSKSVENEHTRSFPSSRRIIVLNKTDHADSIQTREWIKHFEEQNCVTFSSGRT